MQCNGEEESRTCVEEVSRELMVGIPTRCIIEEGDLAVTRIVLYVLGGMIEADIIKAAGAAQWAPIQAVLSPFQPCIVLVKLGIQSTC